MLSIAFPFFLNPKVDTPEIIYFYIFSLLNIHCLVLLYMYTTWRITTQRCSKLNVTVWGFLEHLGNTNLKSKLTLQTLSPVSLMVIKIQDILGLVFILVSAFYFL